MFNCLLYAAAATASILLLQQLSLFCCCSINTPLKIRNLSTHLKVLFAVPAAAAAANSSPRPLQQQQHTLQQHTLQRQQRLSSQQLPFQLLHQTRIKLEGAANPHASELLLRLLLHEPL